MARRMVLWAVPAGILAAAMILGMRPARCGPIPDGGFPVEVTLPASHGRLIGTGVTANSLMLVFEDEAGTIRIYDYLKRDRDLSESIRIDRR